MNQSQLMKHKIEIPIRQVLPLGNLIVNISKKYYCWSWWSRWL